VNGIDILVQSMKLGAELLGTTRKQAKKFGEKAGDAVHEFQRDAPKRAKDLGKRWREEIYPEPSDNKALQFIAGLSVGLGAALLFAPQSGKQTRDKIRNIRFPKRSQEWFASTGTATTPDEFRRRQAP